MTVTNWIEWCAGEMSDTAGKLARQGYHPVRIEQLQQTSREFAASFDQFQKETERVMLEMTSNPDGYHHFESFAEVKQQFLQFTNLHRARFLETDLAHTA